MFGTALWIVQNTTGCSGPDVGREGGAGKKTQLWLFRARCGEGRWSRKENTAVAVQGQMWGGQVEQVRKHSCGCSGPDVGREVEQERPQMLCEHSGSHTLLFQSKASGHWREACTPHRPAPPFPPHSAHTSAPPEMPSLLLSKLCTACGHPFLTFIHPLTSTAHIYGESSTKRLVTVS